MQIIKYFALAALISISAPAQAAPSKPFAPVKAASKAALAAFSTCWIDAYGRLHARAGTENAIVTANGWCVQLLDKYKDATNVAEALRLHFAIMEWARVGHFDNIVSGSN